MQEKENKVLKNIIDKRFSIGDAIQVTINYIQFTGGTNYLIFGLIKAKLLCPPPVSKTYILNNLSTDRNVQNMISPSTN